MSKFACKVEGDSRAADTEGIRRALEILIGDDQTYEVRGIWRSPDFARSRVCRSIEEGVEAALSMEDAAGVYFTLNPCRPGLDKAAANADIESRRWILVDCDPVKPVDLSATDAEREASIDLACTISEALAAAGWPDAVWIESGNGAHLLYPCDLPNDKLSQQLVRDALGALGDRHDTPGAKVDRAVHNAARISKLPGTWVRKGPDTPDRPHRMARLVRAPEHGGEVVTAAMLRELAAPPPKPSTASPWTAKATDGDGLKRYVRSAVERECARVLMAPEGTRNNALNTAAFNLATMSRWPEMDASDAKILLYEAAKRAGLSEHETKLTIESGWTAGAKEDRPRPQEQTYRGTQPAPKELPADVPLTIRGDKIEPKKVTWLWPDRIALGFISLFVGRTGIGKSFVLLDFAARITRGDLIPNSMIRVPQGNVLIISEDPHDFVLAPRLIEMGAEMSRTSFFTWEAMAAYSLANTPMLERAFVEAGEPSLIIIDPPSNFMGGKDEHKNSDVRQTLMLIVAWLSARKTACVMVTHEKKPSDKGVEALYRIMSSVAWASTARIACGFYPDPKDKTRSLFAGIKSNLGAKAKTLAYRIVKTETLAVVEWLGESDTDADEASAYVERAEKPHREDLAAPWLLERFREKPVWEFRELERLGKEAGHSKHALYAAAKELPIDQIQRGRLPGIWMAREGWPTPGE